MEAFTYLNNAYHWSTEKLIHLFFDNLFQVDLPVQQSFLWYRSSKGDALDPQVLLNMDFSQLKMKYGHIFDSSNVYFMLGIWSLYI